MRMVLKQSDTTRRRLLKGIGATGLALSAASVAAAKDSDSAESEGDVSPDGYWEYRCTDMGCSGSHGCQEQKRYCNNGSCSGWEASGCCGCLS